MPPKMDPRRGGLTRRNTAPRNAVGRQPVPTSVPPPSANLRTRRNSSQPLKTPTPQESDIRQAPILGVLGNSMSTGSRGARGRDTRNTSKRASQSLTSQTTPPSRSQSTNDLVPRNSTSSSSPEPISQQILARSRSVESTIEVETEPEKALEKSAEKTSEKVPEKEDPQLENKRTIPQRRKSGRAITEGGDSEISLQQLTGDKEYVRNPRHSTMRGSSRRIDGSTSGRLQNSKNAKSSMDSDDSEGSGDDSLQPPLRETREEKLARTQALREQRLRELDEQQQQVEQGTHPNIQKRLDEIEDKRRHRLDVAAAQRKHKHENITNQYKGDYYHAINTFMFAKLVARRDLMEALQNKISTLSAEIKRIRHQEADPDFDDDDGCDDIAIVQPFTLSSTPQGLHESEANEDLAMIQGLSPHPSHSPTSDSDQTYHSEAITKHPNNTESWDTEESREHKRGSQPRIYTRPNEQTSSGLTTLSDAAEQHYQQHFQTEQESQTQQPWRSFSTHSTDRQAEHPFETAFLPPNHSQGHPFENNNLAPNPHDQQFWDHSSQYPRYYHSTAPDYRLNEETDRTQKRYRYDDGYPPAMETRNEHYPPESHAYRQPPTNAPPLPEFGLSAPRESAFTRVSPRQDSRYPTSPYPPYYGDWPPQSHYEEMEYYRSTPHGPGDRYPEPNNWSTDESKRKKRNRDREHREHREHNPSNYPREMVMGTS